MEKLVKVLVLVAVLAVPAVMAAYFIRSHIKFVKKLMSASEERQLGYETSLELYRRSLKGPKIKEWFDRRSISEVSVYGYNKLSQIFYEELTGSGIAVKSFIDDGVAGEMHKGTPIIGFQESVQGDSGVIIVSDLSDFAVIENRYKKNGYRGKVYSIQDSAFMIEEI